MGPACLRRCLRINDTGLRRGNLAALQIEAYIVWATMFYVYRSSPEPRAFQRSGLKLFKDAPAFQRRDVPNWA